MSSFTGIMIKSHRSTTYVDLDAAYCYQSSSVVCRSVTLMSPAKTAKAIEMPFALKTRVGPRNHALETSRALRDEYCILGIPHNTTI